LVIIVIQQDAGSEELILEPPQEQYSSTPVTGDSSDTDSLDEVTLTKRVTIHRTTLLRELLEIFSEENILHFDIKPEIIDVHGDIEQGVGSGVMRDVVCSFFDESSFSHMAGCQEKVPTVRHDMGEIQWKAFGRIIAYAFKIGYFPLYISPVFLTSCLFGDSEINNESLLNGFMLYVGTGEKDVIEKNLAKLDAKDEDLLDFLDSYGSHSLPKDGSFKELVLEIAHQELIQKPKYIASCFSDTLQLLQKSIGNIDALYTMYKEKDPTPSKVVKVLDVEKNLDAKQQKIITFLIKFIKSLDKKDLRLFLRFVTASETCRQE